MLLDDVSKSVSIGVGLGCIAAGAKQVTPDIMLAAAKAAAIKLTPEELERDSILPQVDRIRCASPQLGVAAVHAVTCCILIAPAWQVTRPRRKI